MERDIYLKELTHMIMEAGKPKPAGWAGKLETHRRADMAAQGQRSSGWRDKEEPVSQFKSEGCLRHNS